MAALPTITPDEVTIVRATQGQVHTHPAGEAITAGSYVFVNSSGKVMKSGAATAAALGRIRGVAVTSVTLANQTITFVSAGGYVELGDTPLDGLNPGDPVYVSDTVGGLDTATGTVSTVAGLVYSFWMGNQFDKILWVQ